jgi:serine/threonine protein kinase
MNSSMTSGRCPTCGAELPENAPQGLCPKCLLLGVVAPTQTGQNPEQRPAPPEVEAVRTAFPQLEILELIGQGGMGAVFKARQPKLNRFVALKILPESMARDPAFAERLAREGQLLARLTHPNVVTVHDFGSANGFFYLLMEYVDGVNLRQAMQAGRFTAEQALAIVPMICEALQYAHDEGVLHRDIKPENILLDTRGRVKLVDFGIAKLAGRDEPAATGSSAGVPADLALTQSGSALGTPSYMAPEQRSSPSTVDQRADIYSLGVVFYEMLTGELPTGNFARPSSRTPMDPRVDDVVMRAMARQKEQRFQSVKEVRTRVEAITTAQACPLPHTSDPIPVAAMGHPIPLSPLMEAGLTIGLLTLFVLMLSQLNFLPMVHQLFDSLQGRWSQRLLSVFGIVIVGWVGYGVWCRRDWLAAPFRSPQVPTDSGVGGDDERNGWTRHLWLSTVLLGVLGVLFVQLIWIVLGSILMFAQMEGGTGFTSGTLLWLFDFLLMGMALPIALMILLVRREVRRVGSCSPSPAPEWMPRAALLTVIFSIVTTLPEVAPQSVDGVTYTSVGLGGFMVVVTSALLTRSRIWRAIAIAVLSALLVAGVVGLCFFLVSAARHQLPVEWPSPVDIFHAVLIPGGTQFLSLWCIAIGLFALLLPSARAAFGLPPRKGRGEPASAPVHA